MHPDKCSKPKALRSEQCHAGLSPTLLACVHMGIHGHIWQTVLCADLCELMLVMSA